MNQLEINNHNQQRNYRYVTLRLLKRRTVTSREKLMSQKIQIISGVPGCGKSSLMIKQAASSPGLYLFAVPTIDLIAEQARYFRALCPSAETIEIHSENSSRAKVSRQIDELLSKPNRPHVAAWITHESLLNNDFDGFRDWHARIDEPPSTIKTGSIKSKTSLSAFQDRFNFEPVDESEWARLTPKQSSTNWKETADDALWANLTDFLKLASRSSGVFIKAKDWKTFGSGNSIAWLSYWSPSALEHFRTAQIAGSSYLSSIGHLANTKMANQPGLEERDISSNRTKQPTIKIRYFTQGHTGSTEFWKTTDGRYCIKKIGDWLSNYEPALGFWTGNQVVTHSLEHRISGKLVSPKLAGLNQYRNLESCAMFYSAKAQPSDSPLYDIFELDKTDVKNAREGEDIFQFVFRGAIRNPDYDGCYTVYLYSEDQALELSEKLNTNGLHNILVEPIDEAGIMDFERAQSSLKKILAPSQVAKKEDSKREKGRLRVAKYRAKKKAVAGTNQDK